MTNPYVQAFKELQAELEQPLQKTAASKPAYPTYTLLGVTYHLIGDRLILAQ